MASAIATSAASSSLTTLHHPQRIPSPTTHSDATSEPGSCCQVKGSCDETPFIPPSNSSIPLSKCQDHRLQELSTRTTELSLRDDELGSSDEVKVFKDEGEEEKEFISCEEIQAALLEDKSSLIEETELAIKEECSSRLDGRGQQRQRATSDSSPHSPFPNGYSMMSPYLPPNTSSYLDSSSEGVCGSIVGLNGGSGPPGSHHSNHPPPPHMVRSTGSPLSPLLYGDPLGSPPPAHMGGLPYSLDPSRGLRPFYPIHPSSYPYSLLSSSDVSQFSPWTSPLYAAAAWRNAFPFQNLFSSNTLFSTPLSRFGPGGILSPPGGYSPHHSSPSLVGNGGSIHGSEDGSIFLGGGTTGAVNPVTSFVRPGRGAGRGLNKPPKKSHIKKPLNAFMLYMKEMRPQIVAECTLKESAAINQILGRRWHGLSREEQAKYYDQARKERQLHMQMYPGWSARDNYAQNKKKSRKQLQREKNANCSLNNGSNSLKKCRAKYGLDQQDLWCKPCNPKDKVLSLSQGLSSHSLLTSSASTAQVVSSIVDAGETQLGTTNCINSPGLLSTLNNPSEPSTNNIINLLASTSNNSEGFDINNGNSSSSAIVHHPVVAQPPPQTQLPPTHPDDTLDHTNRSGIHVIQSPGSSISHRNNHSHNNNSSPIGISERIDHTKLESLENGSNDHSPKYISL